MLQYILVYYSKYQNVTVYISILQYIPSYYIYFSMLHYILICYSMFQYVTMYFSM